MLRTLALVLLLANALLAAALSGLFDSGTGEREPERLQRQHQPGLVRILGPQAASAALDAASQAAAAASSASAAVCLEAGPFSAADAATAERSLRDAGLPAGSWQAQHQEDAGAFMVYMGRYADRELLQRKMAELKRMKLEGEDLRNAPELQPGISLGRFDNQPAAQAALAAMTQRGVRTARVITLRQAQSQTMLRVAAADAALRARLAGLQLPSGPGFLPCVAGSPATAAAASAAASAVAAGTASGPASGPVAGAASGPASQPAAVAAGTAASAVPRPARTPGVVAPTPVAPAAPASPARVASSAAAPAASRPAAVTPAAPPPASSAPQARVAGADTRAALARAAAAEAGPAASAAPGLPASGAPR